MNQTDTQKTGTAVAEEAAEMERLNERQRTYYEQCEGELSEAGNTVTRSWALLRDRVAQYRVEIGVKQDIRSLHMQWLGDLAGCRTMELGCSAGNNVSMHMAKEADSYLGVDLNSVGIERLKQKFVERDLPKGDAVAADFLSPDFQPEPFDVIFAHGVLHHFRYFDAFLEILHSRLKPGGRVIAFDPLQTAMLPRLIRYAYRPFQSDADWEWPFNRKTFPAMERYFDVAALQGTMGWAKWGIPLLPISFGLAVKVGRPLHGRDMRMATSRSRHLWRCMNVATLLVRKELKS
tara:strand:+ start:66547 stop:67419 length:873 start_codon:yes stop_codon:yes gene_type:complete